MLLLGVIALLDHEPLLDFIESLGLAWNILLNVIDWVVDVVSHGHEVFLIDLILVQ